MRIVLDTNILVRAVSGRSINSFVFDKLFNQKYTLCVSTEILLEYEEVLSRIYDKETAELVISSLLLLPNVMRTEVFALLGVPIFLHSPPCVCLLTTHTTKPCLSNFRAFFLQIYTFSNKKTVKQHQLLNSFFIF